MQMRDWERLMAPIRQRFSALIRYGRLTGLDSSAPLQRVQARTLAGEVLDSMEYFEPYGFTSAPTPGAEMLLQQVGAQRGNEVVICIADRRFRLAGLQPGEVALFDDLGNKVHLTRSGMIVNGVDKVQVNTPVAEVNATESATITTAVAEITASSSAGIHAPDIELDGNVICTGTFMSQGVLTPAAGIAGVGDAPVSAAGGITTDDDIVAGGISLKNHHTSGVTPGSGTSGGPVA